MHHLMVDIETLALDERALILQVGAVEFNPFEGTIGQPYSWDLDYRDQHTRSIDADTVLWWMRQSDEARKAVMDPRFARTNVHEFLKQFRGIVEKSDRVWAHYTDFDLRKLNNLSADTEYWSTKEPLIPWFKWRDAVALRDFVVAAEDGKMPEFPGQGKEHIALEDAILQAKVVNRAYDLMKWGAEEDGTRLRGT